MEATANETPALVPDGEKQCCRCGAVKALDDFWREANGKDGRKAACAECLRRDRKDYRRTERGRAARAAYLARPEVIAARKEYARARADLRPGVPRAWDRSLRGRLMKNRAKARHRLAHARTEASRARIGRTVALYDAEIARLDRARAAS